MSAPREWPSAFSLTTAQWDVLRHQMQRKTFTVGGLTVVVDERLRPDEGYMITPTQQVRLVGLGE